MIGQRFGKLVAIEAAASRKYPDGKTSHRVLKCRCDCGNETYVTATRLRTQKAQSCGCGISIAATERWARTRKPNFLRKIDMSGGVDACWEWQGSCDTGGYGMTSFEGKAWKTHRLAYTLLKGPIPKGKYLLHSCDNRKCCNPGHLRPGDQWENMQDLVDRGRAKGKHANNKNPMAKLDFEKAREIRDLYASGLSQQMVADRFGVSQHAVSMIVRNRRYIE